MEQKLSSKQSLEELSCKILLTVEEASRLSGLGICAIRKRIKEPKCPYLIKVGNKQMIKREKFEKHILDNRRY